jgi:hypothetical protein
MDEFQHWRDNLAGKKPAIHDGEPQCGFYRRQLVTDGPWVPAAIWQTESNGLVCKVGDRMRDPVEQWSWLAKNPVRKDDARTAFETGRWPDEVSDDEEIADDATADVKLNCEIKKALAWLDNNQVDSEESAEKAAKLKSDVANSRLAADKARKAEKEPHLEAGRAVDAKYNPLIKAAKTAEAKIASASTAYMLEKKRKADAIAEAAAKAAREEQERIEAEERARQHNLPEEEKTLPAEEPRSKYVAPPPPVTVGGPSGGKMRVKEEVQFVVTDYQKALAYFANDQAVVDLINLLATRKGRAGVIADGVERKVVEVVR